MKQLLVVAMGLFIAACGSDRRFQSIDGVKVYYLSETGGLAHRKLTQSKVRELKICLLKNTKKITEDQREIELLPSSFLIEVTNGQGTVSMELLSRNNLTDRLGVYENKCVWDLVRYADESMIP